MTADTSLHASSVHEFLAAVPYLLGYHPDDSLVVVAFRDRVTVNTMRAPLGAPPDEAVAILVRQGADQAAVIGYGEAARVTPDVLRMSERLRARGIPVVDEFRVTDGRFWSYRCTDPDCCPAEGRPYRVQETAIAARLTYAGQVALPDRDALAAQLAPVTGAERAGMSAATERARARLAETPAESLRRTGRAAVRAAEVRCRGTAESGRDRREAGQRLTDDEVAWLGVLLEETKIRDYAWTRTAGELWRIELWKDMTRRVDPLYVAAPASLLAFAAWRRGEGPLANVALERALAADPAYSMAHLIGQAVDAGLPPDVLEQGWQPVPRQDRRRGTGPRRQGRPVS